MAVSLSQSAIRHIVCNTEGSQVQEGSNDGAASRLGGGAVCFMMNPHRSLADTGIQYSESKMAETVLYQRFLQLVRDLQHSDFDADRCFFF